MLKNLKLFVRLTKIDEANRIVYGRATDESVDSVNEVMDYDTSKPLFEAWSEKLSKATDGKSKGNLRAMHGKVAAGRLDQLVFDDEGKGIDIAGKVVDDNEWQKCLDGVYTGFSIGGSYVKKWKDGDVYRYTCNPVEISLVDLPCNPNAMFDTVKADGTTLQKRFQPGSDLVAAKVVELAKAAGLDPAKLEGPKVAELEGTARGELAKTIHDPAPITEVTEEAPPAPDKPEPTNDQIVAKAAEIAKTKGGTWTAHTDEARAVLMAAPVASPGAPAAVPGATGAPVAKTAQAAALAPAQPDPAAADGDWQQVWVSKRLPGQSFTKKADLQAALTALDAAEKAATAAGPVTALLAKLSDQVGGVTAAPAASILAAEIKKGAEALAEKNHTALAKAAGVDLAVWPSLYEWVRENAGHDLVKALGQQTLKIDRDGAVIEVPAATAEAIKAIDAARTAKPAPSAEQLAALVKAGEARGTLVIKTAADLEAAIARKDLGPGARRFVMKRAKALKLADKVPADWLVAPAPVAKDAAPELQKAASLYSLCRMIELLASLQSCEQGMEYNDLYCGVAVPAEMQTRFGTLLVEFGDLVADVLEVILQHIRDEESGEAMTRAAAAHDLLKGIKLVGGLLEVFADPAALAKLAPTGGDAGQVEKLAAQLAAQETTFTATVGTIAKGVEDLIARLKKVEDQPLPPGTSQVSKQLRVADKTDDSAPLAGPSMTAEQVLADPANLAKLADIAVRAAQSRPIHALPGHNNPAAR